MKKLSFKAILIPTISLFLICFIVAVLLAGTNELTKNAISDNQQKKADEAKAEVCLAAVVFEEVKGIDAEAYKGLNKDGKLVGYAIPASHKGYGGEIEIMVGMDVDGNITGVSILSINETPGLGMNANGEEFRNQFKGEIPSGGFSANGTQGKQQIDALTGATITSEAVSQAVNKAIDVYNMLEGGDK